ncbi:hypothetical protein ACE6H2_020507 [Prunus campanulata]
MWPCRRNSNTAGRATRRVAGRRTEPVVETQTPPLKERLKEEQSQAYRRNSNTTAGRTTARSTEKKPCYHNLMPNCHSCNKGISQVQHAMQ